MADDENNQESGNGDSTVENEIEGTGDQDEEMVEINDEAITEELMEPVEEEGPRILKCALCDVIVDKDEGTAISSNLILVSNFSTKARRKLVEVLGVRLAEPDSDYLCECCFNQLDKLEHYETLHSELKTEITRKYEKSHKVDLRKKRQEERGASKRPSQINSDIPSKKPKEDLHITHCPNCGIMLKFANKHSLQDHLDKELCAVVVISQARTLAAESKKGDFTCEKCNRFYRTQHHLEKHVLCHKTPLEQCTGCNRMFADDEFLQQHLKKCVSGGRSTVKITTRNSMSCRNRFIPKGGNTREYYSRNRILAENYSYSHIPKDLNDVGKVQPSSNGIAESEDITSQEPEEEEESTEGKTEEEVAAIEEKKKKKEEEKQQKEEEKKRKEEQAEKERLNKITADEAAATRLYFFRAVSPSRVKERHISHKGKMYQLNNKDSLFCSVCGWFSDETTRGRSLQAHLNRNICKDFVACKKKGLKECLTKNDYCCDTCYDVFDSRAHLRAHTDLHRHNQLYKCKSCCKRFVEKTRYEAHTADCKPKFQCEACNQGFHREKDLQCHLANCKEMVDVDVIGDPDSFQLPEGFTEKIESEAIEAIETTLTAELVN